MSALYDLTNSDIGVVVDAASRAVELNVKLKAGDISHSEYEELYEDITRLENIDKAMFTEEVYLKIKQAYTIIATFKSLASII